MANVITAGLPHKAWPGGENKDRVRAALLSDALELLRKIFHHFLGCDHEGPPNVKAVVFLDATTYCVHATIFIQT
jgi:hypothetical protein